MAIASHIEAWTPGCVRTQGEGRLRVLVLDEALPHPPDSGKRLRTWHLLRRLAHQHTITLLAYGSGDAARDRSAVAALESEGIESLTVAPPSPASGWRLHARLLCNCASPWPYSVAKHHTGRMEAALAALWREGRFDLVQVEWTPFASHLRRSAIPHLIASHNIEAQIWRRRAAVSGPAGALYFRWQAAKMRRFEQRAFARAAGVTAVSHEECSVARSWGANDASVVANGVDLEWFQPRSGAVVAGRLVFVGALDWHPNEDAVLHFVEAIAPRLRALRPESRLQVVGRRPSAALRRRLQAACGVELVGEVEDVRPHLAGASAVVVPLRIGGGSRIKILEALAMEKAVISTRVGAEGLGLEDGRHLLLADGDEEFARTAAALLGDDGRAQQLGREGAERVRAQFSWNRCAQDLESAWRCVLRNGGEPGRSARSRPNTSNRKELA
ncbi:MAG TPA: glycosyltransferase family 4 protein [Terriglobales bacterium]|nr:glycosyltransferase family 4 protein [Terriglobales bacterium]